MNINNLLEKVPVDKELPPIDKSEKDWEILEWSEDVFVHSLQGKDAAFYAYREKTWYSNGKPLSGVTHWYRPVTRESIEAFLREFGEAYGKSVLQSISDTFLKPDNLAKASFNDQPAIQAMGETIVNFPLPDITELIKQYTEQ